MGGISGTGAIASTETRWPLAGLSTRWATAICCVLGMGWSIVVAATG